MSGREAHLHLPGLGMSSLPNISQRHSSRTGPRPPRVPPLRAPFTARTTTVKKLLLGTSEHELSPSMPTSSRAGASKGALVTVGDLASYLPEGGDTRDPRSKYVELVQAVRREKTAFRSPALFCEALLRRAEHQPGNTGSLVPSHSAMVPAARRQPEITTAAAACWALDVLADSEASPEVLGQIRSHLFPCLFVNYDEAARNAPGFVRSRFADPEIQGNPYLGTDFYFEHHILSKDHITELANTNDLLKARLEHVSASVRTVLQRNADHSLRPFFTSWRQWCRANRIDRFAKDLMRRHGHRDTRRYLLDGAMARWRLVVEQSRTVDLKQRMHALEYQLENTKNQFQLQCFRSDKYLRLVEELREELSQTREVRDALRTEVQSLQQQLREFQDASRSQLNRYVSVMINELGRWRRFARRKVESGRARAEVLAFVHSGDSLRADAEDAGDDVETGTDNTTSEIESQLLQWCSGVMRQSVVSNVKEVTNWTSDWHSGEVLLLLMHHVFPGQVPLAPLQEAAIAKRTEQVVEIGKKVGVAHLPQPVDLMEGAGDMMILVAAELYNRHASITRVSDTAPPFEPMEHLLEQPKTGRVTDDDDDAAADADTAPSHTASLPAPEYDSEMLPDLLADVEKEFSKLVDQDHDTVMKDKHVWRTQEVLNGYSSYITRERLQGRSVVVVDKKDVARFCKFNKNRFGDIAGRFKMPPVDYVGMWLNFDQQLDSLKSVLQRTYQDLRRIFTHYCRGKTLMSEADFWRLISDVRALDRNVTRSHVDKIFSIANDDTPPVAKTGRSGFNGNDESSEDDDDDDDKDDLDDVELDDEENSETELIPSEFVECLIRIAERKFPGKMLHERFSQFMTVHVVPFACKSDTDKFKKEIHNAQTQTAVQKYQKDLIKIFNFYAKGAAGKQSAKKKMMVAADFMHFLKESNAMSQSLDDNAAASVFSTVSSSAEEINKEIDHREFIEAVVCMSVFKTPSPFVPLDKKVEVISSSIISNLRPKLKPTVTLSDVQIVTLKQA
jgi:FtsZ-binding cell division protein ZapB